MRMLTLNCHSLLDYDSDKQIQEIVDQIVREEIDVLSLQEANQSQFESAIDEDDLKSLGYKEPAEVNAIIKKDNFAYRLSRALKKVKLDFKWSWNSAYGGENGLEWGVALFSRLCLTNVHSTLISSNDFTGNLTKRCVLLAQLADEMKTVVAAVHFNGENSSEFRHEWSNLMETIAGLGLSKRPVYLLGNFNVDAEVDTGSYTLMCQEFEDTYCSAISKGDGMTVRGKLDGWDDSGISERLDYILTNAQNEVSYSRICFDGNIGPRISNHAGVLIEVSDDSETCSA
ncbi:MAG: endonuclease/exonuclease/phosphatase family protein [Lactobacillus sp.]|nr:endonuclease/exonuclease/phosphatase family protein [Lactobacillus sp.]